MLPFIISKRFDLPWIFRTVNSMSVHTNSSEMDTSDRMTEKIPEIFVRLLNDDRLKINRQQKINEFSAFSRFAYGENMYSMVCYLST